jgi:lipoate-protein ligase A
VRASFLADDVAAPRRGARNMAVDHALLESAQHDQTAALRLYRWQPACLSFGRNQPARGFYDAELAAQLGIDIVRRPTGGLAVLHDRELTYAFCAPAKLLGGPRSTYLAVNRALVAGLRRLGVPAELSGGAERSRFGTVQPCFAEPAAGEVVVHRRKLVGSAQRCEQHTILQHGSILLDGTQAEIGRIAAVPFDMSGRATSIIAVLGSLPDFAEIASALVAGFQDECGICLAPAQLSAGVAARVTELEQLYASTDWTWRR